ncbi:MAG: plastocyanin/azurin family copper-binding protein [Acidobacteriota bacterium]|nr:plastocyanin/azurin family copper-binding protein [Acidobacteriota bacterium]
MSSEIDRRKFFSLAGSSLATLGFTSQGGLPVKAPDSTSTDDVHRILALFSYNGGVYYFDPAGLYIDVGQTVEWVGVGRRAVTTYHPSIHNHELRIPESAAPFDSKSMGSGSTFRWTFDVEGTYDYYSPTHEYLGMVGRVIVGKPGGPGEESPGYGNRHGRAVMYRDAARVFEYLESDKIVTQKSIAYPMDLVRREFPWR